MNARIKSTTAFFFFNDTATTEIYTLSLHDALPISGPSHAEARGGLLDDGCARRRADTGGLRGAARSEEHTSELQSRPHLVCRLLLEKKNILKVDGMNIIINDGITNVTRTGQAIESS